MTIEAITNLIQNRRSVFPHQFTGEEVQQAVIEKILENANWAPNHKLTAPWRFKILRGGARERLAQFLVNDYLANTPLEEQKESKIKKMSENPVLSSCVIVICMQQHPSVLPTWEEVAAVAMSVQNLWLSCATLGVGGYWSSPAAIERMGNFIDLAPDEICLGLFYLGCVANDAPTIGKRESLESKMVWLDA